MRFLFLLLFALAEATQAIYIPPSGWEIAQLKNESKVGFIGKGSSEFRPSIHLATEEIDISLKEYVKAIKQLYFTDEPNSTLRDLGKLPMKGGTGHLIQKSDQSLWGTRHIFQAILVSDKTAYILTAAVLNEDLPKFQNEILQSMRSLTLLPDLWSCIDLSQKKELDLDLADKKWEAFQKKIASFSNLGPYWQFLALKEGRSKLNPGTP